MMRIICFAFTKNQGAQFRKNARAALSGNADFVVRNALQE
jgi:hypothetical protein